MAVGFESFVSLPYAIKCDDEQTIIKERKKESDREIECIWNQLICIQWNPMQYTRAQLCLRQCVKISTWFSRRINIVCTHTHTMLCDAYLCKYDVYKFSRKGFFVWECVQLVFFSSLVRRFSIVVVESQVNTLMKHSHDYDDDDDDDGDGDDYAVYSIINMFKTSCR